MKCCRCSSTESIQEHHTIPKGLKEKSLEDGMKIWLCKKCHDILQNMLLGVVWHYVEKKEEAKDAIRNYTNWFIRKK